MVEAPAARRIREDPEGEGTHRELLRGVSRTFTLSIELLPPVLRDALTISYLMLRVSDCLEDHPEIPPARKAELLRLWATIIEGDSSLDELVQAAQDLDPEDPEVRVTLRAESLLRGLGALPGPIREAIERCVTRTSRGMARWQEHGPFVEDEAAMDDYMHQVAGRIGYMLTEFFAFDSPVIRARKEELMPLSREYGLALQTVNIIRGMRQDFERGWVFVPRTFYEAEGLTPEAMFDPAREAEALRVVERLADKAEGHLQAGATYVRAFPRRSHRVRLACMWPLLFAVRTLAVSRGNPAVLRAEAKIGRAQVRSIMQRTRLLGWSNSWLAWYTRRLARSPLTS